MMKNLQNTPILIGLIPIYIGLNPIRIGGGRNQPYGLLIAFKHAKMEKLKNKNLKKRPPLAPTPHQYPGIYRIYEYGLHKASGVQEIGKKRVFSYFTRIIAKKPSKAQSA